MSLVANTDITPAILRTKFQEAVVNNILAGSFHAGNIPMCRGNQCVPVDIMDHLDNVNRVPVIGDKANVISANFLLNGLIALTRNLTRVGTFTYTIWMRVSDTRTGNSGSLSYHDGLSGKVLFTPAFIRTQFTNPSDVAGTTIGSTISAANLNTLFANIYQHWMNTSKHHHTGSTQICHSSCHSNCHSSCHSNCHSNCHMNCS